MTLSKDQTDLLLGLRDMVAQKRLIGSKNISDPVYRQGFEEALAWVRGTIDDMIGI